MKIRSMQTNGRGFSLIEILIAVVILSTGFLALTALQGRLAQASAEAKVRSRVAVMLTSRMDALRAGAYENSALVTATNTCSGGAPLWLCDAQTESGVAGLSVGQTVTRYSSAVGATTFSTSGGPAAAVGIPEFKRIALTATWNDAVGAAHSLGMSSDISELTLSANLFPSESGGSAGKSPIVRQDNPAGPGVIPIAIGGDDATAASNPRPEVIGRTNNSSVVGTRFDVLTYNGLSGASVIQRRVETAAISCKCQYGAGGTNLGEIYRTAQWPAEWTGERYEVIAPVGATMAPGDALASKSGPVANLDQSPLCTECCRDHHDAATNATKFDPARTGDYDHYNASLTAVGNSNGTQYIEACRLVRVDGFWRTATDMYAKHFALINTSAVGGVLAKSGEPDPTAVTAYQAYVKLYLGSYTGSTADISNAADGGQVAGTSVINILAPPPADERYLHARGLYVDHLNQKARNRIIKARSAANCPGGDLTECSLPYLPFTTINNTELSYWEPRVSGSANTTVISVATGSTLIFDPLQPTRGRTNAKSSAINGATSDATAIITRSNAGVAIAPPVDLGDAALKGVDNQRFRVVASGTGATGENFSVELIGLPQTTDDNTSTDPRVGWANPTGNRNCDASIQVDRRPYDFDPNNYACNTFGTLGIATSVRFENYYREYTDPQSVTHSCGTQSVTGTLDRPTFADYEVSEASVGGVSATRPFLVTNNKKLTEATIVSFAEMPSGGLVRATFTLTETLQAAIASCVAVRKNDRSPWEFSNVVWTKQWLL